MKLLEPTQESVRSQISETEWDQRVNLAACFRLINLYGWDDLIFNHFSARVAGPEHHFIINPYGVLFDQVTASSLVKVDVHGNKVMESPYAVNPAGFVIHGAIHEAREDAKCVMHLHSMNGVAVSAQKDGLLPISQQSIFILPSLGYHDYEGIALSDDEKPRLVKDLGDKNYLMLRNHGLITVADNIPDCFVRMYLFETACTVQVRAQAGGELIRIGDAIVAGGPEQMTQGTRGGPGALAWPGLLKRLDAIDPSYRE